MDVPCRDGTVGKCKQKFIRKIWPRRRRENNIKRNLKEIRRLAYSAVLCKHWNEPLGSIRGRTFHDKLRDYQRLKKDSAPWTLLVPTSSPESLVQKGPESLNTVSVATSQSTVWSLDIQQDPLAGGKARHNTNNAVYNHNPIGIRTRDPSVERSMTVRSFSGIQMKGAHLNHINFISSYFS